LTLPIPDELAAVLSSDREGETRQRRAERVAAMLRVD